MVRTLAITTLLSLFVLGCCSVSLLHAQTTNGQVERERKHYPNVRLALVSPAFWTEHITPGESHISFSGPANDGVFPRIDIYTEEGAFSTDEGRATYRSRVRVKLLERHAEHIKLIDEVEREEAGREILEQIFSFFLGSRELSVIAFHFSSGEYNTTVMFSHSAKCIDDEIGRLEALFASIVVDGEGDTLLTDILVYVALIALLIYGGYWVYNREQAAELARGQVADLGVLQRDEAAKGIGELVIGEEEADLDAPIDADTGFKILDLSTGRKKKLED